MKARKQFAAMHEDCITIVRGIKLKNDIINKKHGVESEAKLLLEIQKDKQFFESELTRLKTLMNKMEENYLDPDSMRKLEMIKKQAKKQIDRNEQLMRNLISASFVEIHSHQEDMNHYEISMRNMNIQEPKKVTTFNPYQDHQPQNINHSRASQINIHDQPIVNYELQETLNAERNKVLEDVQRDFIALNSIIAQTAQMVYQQGENLDIITQDMVKTKDNVLKGNAHLIEAAEYQKQAKKKYIIFALIIIVLCLIIGIPIIILT